MSADDSENRPLPDLHQGTLDEGMLRQLFGDIAACAQVTEIIPKYGAREQVPESSPLTLDQARELLLARQVRAIQLRYLHNGVHWADTIMVQATGFRLVRIQLPLANS